MANEHGGFERPERPLPPAVLATEEDEAIAVKAIKLDPGEHRPLLIVAGLDEVLIDKKDNINCFDKRLTKLTKDVPMLVATSRGSDDPLIGELWDQGVVSPWLPIITERGGALRWFHPKGDKTREQTGLKNPDAGRALLLLLGELGVNGKNALIVAIGATAADTSLFREADTSVAVSRDVWDGADLKMDRGVQSTISVLSNEPTHGYVKLR